MSFEFQLFECRYMDDVKISWQAGQREKLYALVEEWCEVYHEDHTPLMNQVAELLQGIEFIGDATFIPLHPCIMCIRELPYSSGAWLPFYFESEYRDLTIQIANSSGTFMARFADIPVFNVARNIHQTPSHGYVRHSGQSLETSIFFIEFLLILSNFPTWLVHYALNMLVPPIM